MLITKFSNYEFEAGIDEAGRGSLAGPVSAAAVILDKNISIPYLNDSKKLSKNKRYDLRKMIEESAIAYSVSFIDSKTIDKINILNSTYMAMHNSIKSLKIKPSFILVDGNRFIPYKDILYKCQVRGDQKYSNIAAASILAKTYRDEYMESLHQKFPVYDWKNKKGYGTRYHIEMIKKYGRTTFHRESFKLKSDQLKLNLSL
ncbi:MAG: ribonuclease HII [Gammaproteobacteria bacterium]